MVTIVQKDDRVLRKKAEPVRKEMFGSEELAAIINDMRNALMNEIDGVAIAAPQISLPYRIFVISGRIFRKKNGVEKPDLVFINPVILKRSKESELMDEGCLSVRWYYGLVKRAKKITIKAYNQKGHEFVMEKSGLLAQIFQHETDHLEGILFTDKAKDLVEIPPNSQQINDNDFHQL
jgi:peptide deformylase